MLRRKFYSENKSDFAGLIRDYESIGLTLETKVYPGLDGPFRFFIERGTDVLGVSHVGMDYKVLGVDLGDTLTEEKLTEILEHTVKMEVLFKYQVKMDDPRLQIIVTGYDFSAIVTKLCIDGLVTVRDTDHEYRGDERDLKWVKDFPLEHEISVDGLPYVDSDDPLRNHLLGLAGLPKLPPE